MNLDAQRILRTLHDLDWRNLEISAVLTGPSRKIVWEVRDRYNIHCVLGVAADLDEALLDAIDTCVKQETRHLDQHAYDDDLRDESRRRLRELESLYVRCEEELAA